MKKIGKITLGVSAAILSNSVFAGDMGPAVIDFDHSIVPFVSAEGFPLWIKFGGITVNRNNDISSADSGTFTSGGARVAAGFIYPFKPNWDLTSEFGWSYFGHTSGSVSEGSLSASLYGVDFLVGAAYKVSNYEIFGKVGALFERADFDFSIPSTYALTSNSIDYYIASDAKTSVTEVLPEVKVGINYDYTPKVAFSIAYMHAFGTTPYANLSSINTNSTTLNAVVNTDLKAPTLDALMFGVRYKFLT